MLHIGVICFIGKYGSVEAQLHQDVGLLLQVRHMLLHGIGGIPERRTRQGPQVQAADDGLLASETLFVLFH